MGFAKSSALAVAFKNMLDQRLPLETVLPLMTSNVAHLLKLHHKGTVATGFDADLLVLNDRHEISSVMVKGVWHIRDTDLLIRGLFE